MPELNLHDSASTEYVQAAELGAFDYCERAWWYQYYRAYPTQNQPALQAGKRFHQRHGQAVRWGSWFGWVAFGLVFIGILVLLIDVFY